MGPIGGAEGGGRSGRMEEGNGGGTRETSSSHTPKHATQTKHVAIQYGRTPSRTLHARSITFEFTQYDQPTWTILSGPGTFKHTRKGIRQRCRCHAAPKPFSCERAREQPRGRTTCYKKSKGESVTVCGEPAGT